VSAGTRSGLLARLRARSDRNREGRPEPLPDPGKPPGNRGRWEDAALTNVDITELVKREIRTRTRPWEK
jgi:hypothetical protein